MSVDVLNQKAITMILAYLITMLLCSNGHDFYNRGKFEEIKHTLKQTLVLAALVAVICVIKNEDITISRGIYIITIFTYFISTGITHIFIKLYLYKVCKNSSKNSQLFLITTKDRVEQVIEDMNHREQWSNKITSIAIIDEDMVGQDICGIPVKANCNTMIAYIKKEVVDEVFINIPYWQAYGIEQPLQYDEVAVTKDIRKNKNNLEEYTFSLRNIIMELENMGTTIHLNVQILEGLEDFSSYLNKMGDIPVVTFAKKIYDYKQLVLKRIMDICGSVIGLIITAVVAVFLAPILYIESPGPIFFKQKRVGKNGRYFYIYKFRSMYKDAEERKKELMDQNEMNGLMFKMTDDPRITKVGKFIRKTSIDELPQFWNVLKGDMSLVGTRPPTVDEFKHYETYHKRRLSTKPGITGLWQVSGRSNIDNFEEVVKLDLEYIDNWSVWQDIKILCKTVMVVFKRGGAK